MVVLLLDPRGNGEEGYVHSGQTSAESGFLIERLEEGVVPEFTQQVMQFGERIREAIREVGGLLISILKIISEAQLGVVFPGAERSKQVVDFRPLELDVLSCFLPPNKIQIELFELVI